MLVPHLVHEPCASDDATGVGEEQRKDVELLRREVELTAVLPGAVRFGIDANALHVPRRPGRL